MIVKGSLMGENDTVGCQRSGEGDLLQFTHCRDTNCRRVAVGEEEPEKMSSGEMD